MPETSLADLTTRVLRHRDERDWAQFHSPKELAISLSVEVAELLALMQWKTTAELPAVLEAKRGKVEDELADILHSLLLLASDLKVDLGNALHQKLEKDAMKYPVDKSWGRNLKYDEI